MAPPDSLIDTGEPARRHLEQRLGLFLVLMVAFVGLSLLFVQIMTIIWQRDAFWEVSLKPGRIIHLGLTLIISTAWAVCRYGGLSLRGLRRLDAAATAAVCLVFALDLSTNPAETRPDNLLLVLISNTLILRAALVPSTPRRTLALGAIATAGAMIAAFVVYGRASAPPLSPSAAVARTAFFAVMTVVGTTLASRVIYGLRVRASQAMRLGQYVLERKLGEGGMGVVYRARHAMLKRPTAVKLISPEKASATAIARFEREVQLTASLAHPNTIAIYDYGRTAEGVFYYAMEYLDGLTLEALVELDGPQPPARVAHILQRMCGALAEAHGVGLIHRDVKPANVILCERGGESDVVKVLDFGLVRQVEGDVKLSADDAVLGTPLYTAPEALTAPDRIDGRSDLYAVGAVGYYLLAGGHVFEGATPVEVFAHHIHSAPAPIGDRLGREVPAALEAIILGCLAKDPADRPATAAALAHEVAACGLAWSQDEATAWWREHGGRAARMSQPAGSETLNVDLSRL